MDFMYTIMVQASHMLAHRNNFIYIQILILLSQSLGPRNIVSLKSMRVALNYFVLLCLAEGNIDFGATTAISIAFVMSQCGIRVASS